MRKGLLLTGVIAWCLMTVGVLAQTSQNWKWSHMTPQGNRLNYIKLWSTTDWYAAGFAGTFMKTSDGGQTWSIRHDVGRKVGTSLQSSPIYDAHFFDVNNGIVVGGNASIFRTTDAGATWTEATSPFAASSTVTLYQVYFLNNSVGYIVGSGGNLVKTTDGGATWSTVASGVTTTLYDIYTANDTLILIATTSGNVRRSTDGGATWSNVNTGVTASLYKIDFATPTVGFAVGASGVCRVTTDGGATWAAANAGMATTAYWDIDFRPGQNGVNVFVTGNSYYIYKSTDLGVSWDTIAIVGQQPWTSTYYAADFSTTGDSLVAVGAFGLIQGKAGTQVGTMTKLMKAGTIYDTWVSSNGQNIITVGAPSIGGINDQVLRSTDGGANWNVVTLPGTPTSSLWSIDMLDDNTGFACGSNSAIYKTTNGGATWDSLVTTLPTGATFRKIDFVNANTGWVFASAPSSLVNFIFKTTDGGLTWTPQSHGISANSNGQVYGAYMVDANVGWLLTWQPRVYKTVDGGNNWTVQPVVDAFTGFFYDIKMVDTSLGYMVGSAGRVYKTTNGGANWDTLSIPTRSYTFYSLELFDPNTIMIFGGTGVTMLTTDGGVTWLQENTSGSTINGSTYYRNTQNNSLTVWNVGTNSFIFKYNLTLVPVELTSFSASVNEGNVVLNWRTATELNNSGFDIERKSGDGEWMKIGFVSGSGTTVAPKDYIFVDNTVENGKYSYRLRQVDFDGSATYSGIVEVDLSSPFTFALDQNYPNPFNPSTNVRYQLAEKSLVTLKVYDVLGNEVAVLVNSTQDAGSYNVLFDASKLSSGMYIYKLSAGKFEKTMKMMMLK